MKRRRNQTRAPMSDDAYAGFLRLLLTPEGRIPASCQDVDAYIRHANEVEPLSESTLMMLGHSTERAA
ncbi:hypothetical protein BH23GEM6_BH23GEM6_19430 [soil metagenome]